MTREIKFRGKSSRKDVDMWLYGDLIKIGNSYHILGKDDMREDGHHITQDSDIPTWIDKDTIGQYTGLKDKDGKEIYDGDVVKDTDGKVGYISFLKQEMGFVIVWKNRDSRLGHRHRGSGYDLDNTIEVIGNIYDNPELLKTE